MSRETLRKLHFNNKGAEQPVQTRSLISDFAVQSFESISKIAKSTVTKKNCGDICQSNMLKKNVKIELSEKVSLHKEYLY